MEYSRKNILQSDEKEVLIVLADSEQYTKDSLCQEIFAKYPYAGEQFKDFCKHSSNTASSILFARSETHERKIAFLFAVLPSQSDKDEKNILKHLSFDTLYQSLDEIARYFAGCDLTVAIPMPLYPGISHEEQNIATAIIKEQLKAFNIKYYLTES